MEDLAICKKSSKS